MYENPGEGARPPLSPAADAHAIRMSKCMNKTAFFTAGYNEQVFSSKLWKKFWYRFVLHVVFEKNAKTAELRRQHSSLQYRKNDVTVPRLYANNQ